jgi:endoglucanase
MKHFDLHLRKGLMMHFLTLLSFALIFTGCEKEEALHLQTTPVTISAADFTTSETIAPTAVEAHGHLQVVGNKIVDKNGNPVQLRGMSLFWSQWIGKYYNYDAIKWITWWFAVAATGLKK